MKKILSIVSLIFIGGSTFATDLSTEIKINSFTYLNNTHLAELCGQVINQKTSPTFIQIAVDPRGKHPVNYNTLAGKNGTLLVEEDEEPNPVPVSLFRAAAVMARAYGVAQLLDQTFWPRVRWS